MLERHDGAEAKEQWLMEWLNYHHLFYFWTVAMEGGINRASKQLRLAPPTISTQIHRLEDSLGTRLLVRQGRNVALTEAGRIAARYAEEIFTLGRDLVEALQGRDSEKQTRLVVGVSDVLPKSIVYRILAPVFRLEEPVRVVCRENMSIEAFMGDLATHAMDMILSDAPAGPGTPVRAYNHLLGECGLAFFAAPALARRLRRGFPRSLDGVPFVLPGPDSTLRRALDDWFRSNEIRPAIVAELDDDALAKTFGGAGLGVFATADVIRKEVTRGYDVEMVGRTSDVGQRFYAISLERKVRHPAVAAICEAARADIFG